ncbi:hypothetical protein [Streptomyces sp. NPDC053367]|uniref:hypothetical protein n=1 Tax=Streptomyces sp. NPDC053367 TaxID=3365700 RepID=UPI0037D7A445
MYVVVQHNFSNPQVAWSRGEALIEGRGAPEGTQVLQFYPRVDGSAATCLWESRSVGDVQRFVDSTLGDAAVNVCYEVDADKAFAERPSLSSAPHRIAG